MSERGGNDMAGAATLALARAVAAEHVAWARAAGMRPAQVVASVGLVPGDRDGWGNAADAVAAAWLGISAGQLELEVAA